MRRLIPILILLLAAACSQTRPIGELENPDEMARPLELEQREAARLAPEVERAPDEFSTSRVIAYVDGEVITYRDILLRAGPQLAVLGEEDQKGMLERETLMTILRDRVVYHAAVERGVGMTRDQLDAERKTRVDELERSGGTLTAFLAERGMSRQEFDEEIKRGWVTQRFMLSAMGLGGGDPRVRPMTDVFVAPGEVRLYWERHPEMFKEPEHAQLQFLTVRAPSGAPDREAAILEAAAIAEAARARLVAGEDWVPVYRQTVGDFAEEDAYGLIDLRRGERADWIEEFAFGSERGTVSEVIRKGSTFFVMRAVGHWEDRVVPYDEVHDRIRSRLGQVRRGMAAYEVKLKLLETSSIQPPERAEELRTLLRTARRKMMDEFDL